MAEQGGFGRIDRSGLKQLLTADQGTQDEVEIGSFISCCDGDPSSLKVFVINR